MKHRYMKQRGLFDLKPTIQHNQLYYGDNLTIMQGLPDACIDLIYLDPPFNSQRTYNLIYTKLTGQPVPEQEEAFCDAWEMDPEKEEMVREMPKLLVANGADDDLVRFWAAWINALRNTQPRLLAYLLYMSVRLFQMRRILKPTGSIFLHCDPTASHYIKVIMDGIFGHANFRNEIIWKRTTAHSDSGTMGNTHDTILYYTRSDDFTSNKLYTAYDQSYMDSHYRRVTEGGRRYRTDNLTAYGLSGGGYTYEWNGVTKLWRVPIETMQELHEQGRIHYTKSGSAEYIRYLDEMPGVLLQDVWTDINPINSQAKERLGYPTQKPIALLERILQASSNEDDVVFDPFAGCGTAIYAAHQLNRKWIGCDIAILSVQIVRDVLFKRYGLKDGEHYEISGVPLSVEGAQDLFDRDPHQFQHWAVELAGGFSSTKYSGDKGVDGRIHFSTQDGLRNMVLSVKGGKLTPAFMRELHGVLEREPSSELGGLICLQEPTKGMLAEAASAGIYSYLGTDYHRLQIRTIQDLLDGRGFDTPSKVQTLNWVKQLPLPL